MNASLVGKTKSDLGNNENSIVEGVFICINCGSTLLQRLPKFQINHEKDTRGTSIYRSL
jgi:hypothetical protein